jgi:hypothetical protein
MRGPAPGQTPDSRPLRSAIATGRGIGPFRRRTMPREARFGTGSGARPCVARGRAPDPVAPGGEDRAGGARRGRGAGQSAIHPAPPPAPRPPPLGIAPGKGGWHRGASVRRGQGREAKGGGSRGRRGRQGRSRPRAQISRRQCRARAGPALSLGFLKVGSAGLATAARVDGLARGRLAMRVDVCRRPDATEAEAGQQAAGEAPGGREDRPLGRCLRGVCLLSVRGRYGDPCRSRRPCSWRHAASDNGPRLWLHGDRTARRAGPRGTAQSRLRPLPQPRRRRAGCHHPHPAAEARPR